jgi:acyl-CoA oxidase
MKEQGFDIDFENEGFRAVPHMRYTLDLGSFGLHFGVFIPTIQSLGDDQQVKKWLQLAKDWKIIGAYSQTELGHGSDVQRLQTTATYDANMKEFVIHTPNLQATKFWPGAVGKVATHTILLARVIT